MSKGYYIVVGQEEVIASRTDRMEAIAVAKQTPGAWVGERDEVGVLLVVWEGR